MARKPTAAQARKVLKAYEVGVFNPLMEWVRDGTIYPTAELSRTFLAEDLMSLHESLRDVLAGLGGGDA